MAAARWTRWYPGFKLTVFALLILNATIFSLQGSWGEGVDSVAWLALLLLFELETAHPDLMRGPRSIQAVRATRLVAGATVLTAAIGYIHERAWLDAVNAWLWIAVVVLLEIELRSHLTEASRRRVFGTVALILYLALLGMVFAWIASSEWFDAYDAALWLVAFATIEMNVLGMPPASRQTVA